jgi:hypothetical protein
VAKPAAKAPVKPKTPGVSKRPGGRK